MSIDRSPTSHDEEGSSSQPYTSISEDNSPTSTQFKTVSLSSPKKKHDVPDEKKIDDVGKKIDLTQRNVDELKRKKTFAILCAIISAIFLLPSFLILLATIGFVSPLVGLVALLHIHMTAAFIQNVLTFSLSFTFTVISAPTLGYSLFQIHKMHGPLNSLKRDLIEDKLELKI